MVHEDAVKDLSEVGVEVLGHVASNVACLAKLCTNALQSGIVDAHLNSFPNKFQLI